MGKGRLEAFSDGVIAILYVLGIVAAPFVPWISNGIYTLVAVIWLIPDRRIERALWSS